MTLSILLLFYFQLIVRAVGLSTTFPFLRTPRGSSSSELGTAHFLWLVVSTARSHQLVLHGTSAVPASLGGVLVSGVVAGGFASPPSEMVLVSPSEGSAALLVVSVLVVALVTLLRVVVVHVVTVCRQTVVVLFLVVVSYYF